ncbi:MAG: hypothetical protein MJ252_26920 [archaeon]|nr:hypothetical protein [archaeon]
MKTNAFFLIFLLISSYACTGLRTETLCRAVSDDCDGFHPCCGKYRCIDYRCQLKSEVTKREEFYPEGLKCNWSHKCAKYYECQSHRCILNKQDLEKAIH